MDRVQLLL